jgi:hypothetical protein
MAHNKYRVFDKKNNLHQVYDDALQGAEQGAEQWAKDCAKQIGGYVLRYASYDFESGENPFKLYDFVDQGKAK